MSTYLRMYAHVHVHTHLYTSYVRTYMYIHTYTHPTYAHAHIHHRFPLPLVQLSPSTSRYSLQLCVRRMCTCVYVHVRARSSHHRRRDIPSSSLYTQEASDRCPVFRTSVRNFSVSRPHAGGGRQGHHGTDTRDTHLFATKRCGWRQQGATAGLEGPWFLIVVGLQAPALGRQARIHHVHDAENRSLYRHCHRPNARQRRRGQRVRDARVKAAGTQAQERVRDARVKAAGTQAQARDL